MSAETPVEARPLDQQRAEFADRRFLATPLAGLFFHSVASSLVVFGIAIPFFLVDYTSLPLTVGILTSLMWIPLSWIIQHWIGIVHVAARTTGIIALWYAWPEGRFIGIPLLIVAVYAFTIVVLEMRWRRRHTGPHGTSN